MKVLSVILLSMLGCSNARETQGLLRDASMGQGGYATSVVRPGDLPSWYGLILAKNEGGSVVRLTRARMDHLSPGLEQLGFGVISTRDNDSVPAVSCGNFPPKNWNASWLPGRRVEPGEVVSIVPVLTVKAEGVLQAAGVTLWYRSGGENHRISWDFTITVKASHANGPCRWDPLDHRRSKATATPS